MIRRTLGVLATGAIGLILASPANAADYGDGTLSCVTGEICLSKDWGSYTWQKHFYWGASHAGYSWTNVGNGDGGSGVQNSASAIKNRDRSCVVKVVDDRGVLPDNYSTFNPGDSTWRYVGSQVNDKNDRHERC